MTTPANEDLTPEERRLVARIEHSYAPEPRSPAQRLLFREAIEERLSLRHRVTRQWRPAFAGAIALALVLFLFPADQRPLPAPDANQDDGHGAALITLALGENDNDDFGDLLPEDYATLAELLDL